MKRLPAIAAVFFLWSCGDNNNNGNPPVNDTNTPKEPANIGYTVVNIYPHDTASFTQGLEWHDGYLYEGTGLEGHSYLIKVKPADGKPVQKISIDPALFGEGITILNGKLYQLTWKNNKVLVYDASSFKKIQEFSWPQEGWGITNNGKELIISTGGNNIYFVDPANFKLLNTVSVWSNYGPLGKINELEYVNGKLYANIWDEDYIVVINPQTGLVEAKLNMEGLLEKNSKRYDNTDVLNGIAYDPTKKSFYITGKRWPSMFEVRLDQ
jgi:glutaminyl-peptide cyclotransferase